MPEASHGLKRGFRAILRHYLVAPATIFVLVGTFVALGILTSTHEAKWARELFIGIGGGVNVVLLIDLALTIREEWQAWPWLFDRLRKVRQLRFGGPRPGPYMATMFLPVHLLDEYIALAFSFGLLAMGPWVLDQTADKDRFFTGFDIVGDRNIWTTWIKFVATSFLVGTGTGFGSFAPTHYATYLIYGFNGVVLFTFVAVVANIMLGWFFDKDHDGVYDTHIHGSLAVQEQAAAAAAAAAQTTLYQPPPTHPNAVTHQYVDLSPVGSDDPFASVESGGSFVAQSNTLHNRTTTTTTTNSPNGSPAGWMNF